MGAVRGQQEYYCIVYAYVATDLWFLHLKKCNVRTKHFFFNSKFGKHPAKKFFVSNVDAAPHPITLWKTRARSLGSGNSRRTKLFCQTCHRNLGDFGLLLSNLIHQPRPTQWEVVPMHFVTFSSALQLQLKSIGDAEDNKKNCLLLECWYNVICDEGILLHKKASDLKHWEIN